MNKLLRLAKAACGLIIITTIIETIVERQMEQKKREEEYRDALFMALLLNIGGKDVSSKESK